MSVRAVGRSSVCSLSRALQRRQHSALAYVPQAASIRSIDPITPRAKPPPFFFTGKPNLYATFDRLTSTLAQVERRLAADGLWPALRGMPKPQRISWKWKSQEEMLEVVNITVMTKTEYDKLMRMLSRLTRIRHYANVVGDARSVETLTTLLLPFEKISVNQAGDHASKLAVSLEVGGSATTGVRGDALDNLKRSLDEHGRSYTSGTRKEASAQAFLIPVEAVAQSMNALNESKVYRTFLERERKKDEARIAQKAKSQAQGAEAMAATWREADARQGRALAEENKRLRALGLETKPIPKGLEVDAEGELIRPSVVDSSEESIEHKSSSAGESSEKGSNKGEQSVKVDFNRPSEVGPSPASSNSPDVLDKRDGTLYFPPGTVAPPNSDPLLGSILVNNIPLHRYFSSPKDREAVLRPFIVSRTTGAFNVFALVKNGGTTGQAEALALAIGRGIAVHQPMAKQALAKWGLRADPRQVERKKTGRPKARKANTWVKR